MGSPITLPSAQWSCLTNPAGLASVGSVAFGFFYSNYYNLKELGTGGFAVCIPTKSGNFGIGFISSGFSVLTENRASITYGRRLGEKIRAGIGLHWLVFNQPSDYRDLYAWIPSLGIQWLPNDRLIFSLSITNPSKQEYRPSGYRTIPAIIATGIGFKPADEFLLFIEAENIHDEKPKYTLGIEVSAGKSIFMRFGINRQHYSCYSIGAGYVHGKLSIDATVCHHPVLGFSPAVGLGFAI